MAQDRTKSDSSPLWEERKPHIEWFHEEHMEDLEGEIDNVESVAAVSSEDGFEEVVIFRYSIPDYRVLGLDQIAIELNRPDVLYGDISNCAIQVSRPGPILHVQNRDGEWWLVNDPDHEFPEPDP